MRIPWEEVKKHTPCFLIDKELLRRNLEEFQKGILQYWGKGMVAYSCKTNSLPWILNYVKDLGAYLEVVSDTEYALAKKIGCEDNHIVFNGPTKGKEAFFLALRSGAYVNIDSKRELRWLKEYDKLGEKAGVGVRVNFDLEAVCPEESLTEGGGNRFGYNVENKDFEQVVKEIQSLTNISLTGLHMHTNSKTRSFQVFEELSKKVCSLAAQYDLTLDFIDMGGSFFVKKGEFHKIHEYIKRISDILRQSFCPQKTLLILEPGSALISTPVKFLTKVLDVKDTNKHRFVVTDGGRMYIDPFMGKTSHVYKLFTQSSKKKEEQIICGHTCMEVDRLMTLKGEREMGEGDLILYDLTGGYTMSLNPLFIEYFPNVFVENGGEYEQVREKWGLEEYLQKNVYGQDREEE